MHLDAATAHVVAIVAIVLIVVHGVMVVWAVSHREECGVRVCRFGERYFVCVGAKKLPSKR
jgi:hypothetical protein